MKLTIIGLTLVLVLTVTGAVLAADSMDLRPSIFERNLQQIRFSGLEGVTGSTVDAATFGMAALSDDFGATAADRKSPFKAFALSAILPGAGQYYNGSRIKPFAFLGIEAAAWFLHIKYNGDGDDATDVYEAYNRAHWSEADYVHYLELAYGVTDDELAHATEVSHHLPDDPNDQQYYEMTGKYDQFAWGWSDAVRHDSTLGMYVDSTVAILGPAYTPNSAMRLIYEDLRHDANKKYDKAGNMLIVVMVNHLAAGFEAYFAARRHNENVSTTEAVLSRLDIAASLRSYHADRDTPFVRLAYKF
jgi:hypothetical protein